MRQASKLKQSSEHFYPLDEDGLEKLFSIFTEHEYKAGEQIICIGVLEDTLRILNTGTVREYYLLGRQEVNTNFYTSNQLISNLSSLMGNIPSRKCLVALTDVVVLEVKFSEFFDFVDTYPEGKHFFESAIQMKVEQKKRDELFRIEKRKDLLYHRLKSEHPQWFNEVSEAYLASYLGVSIEEFRFYMKDEM